MNETLKVDNLNDLTYERFRTAAYATILTGFESGSSDNLWSGEIYRLYGYVDGAPKYQRHSTVELRGSSWSLELFVCAKNGTILIHSTVNGLEPEEIIKELYRQFETVKSKIDEDVLYTFEKSNVTKETIKEWHKKMTVSITQ